MSNNLQFSKKKSFFDYFPPPKFLEMPTVGVHISDTCVRFMEFVKSDHGLAVGRYGKKNFPEKVASSGYMANEANKNEVRKILSLIKSENKIKFINASLPEEKAYLFKTDIPMVDRSEIRSTIEFSLEENVPVQTAKAVFDYSVIGDKPTEDRRFNVGVSVLPEEVVSTYTELFESVGMEPLSFEIEAQAAGRAVIDKGNKNAYLILNFEEFKTGLAIISEEVVQYASTVYIGGNVITAAVAKHFSISPTEAEKLKKETGFLRDKNNAKLFFSLMDSINPLKNEILKVLTYWKTRQNKESDSNKKIEKIILCGKNANLAGFDEYLAFTTKMKVEFAEAWKNAFSIDDYLPPISFLDSLDYVTAIGLALPKEEFSF